jgi:hypothetical protein
VVTIAATASNHRLRDFPEIESHGCRDIRRAGLDGHRNGCRGAHTDTAADTARHATSDSALDAARHTDGNAPGDPARYATGNSTGDLWTDGSLRSWQGCSLV